MTLPADYLERVYAGVLGKIIGVYLGRPFEGWSYDRIMADLGEIWYYVHDRLGKPLIVTDDDISGTFTFVRALPDYGCSRDLTPAQIGQTWLNYLIEERTILWWGGMATSTEHTAYLRLKHGIPAPDSGSMALNGRVVAEQIGAQIFIDGWAMAAPGDPALAADLARRAASVSHDGEAIYGAQVIAAMEALAFVEPDLNTLLDTALTFIPADSIIARLIADLRAWRASEPDWRKTRERLEARYGYHVYGGGCHMIPNHGVIILSLLYGEDDFQKTLMIANTSGWDTDCNAGNVGCLMGIKNGLAGIDAGPDWRGPTADRLYLPTADGGRAITDAATEAVHIANIGRALEGVPPLVPKGGARFHFDLPGSVQGFRCTAGQAVLENVAGHSADGSRSLAVRFRHVAPGYPVQIGTATFIPPDAAAMPGYSLLASPTLYPGQTVRARVATETPVTCRLYARIYTPAATVETRRSPPVPLAAGAAQVLTWPIEDTGGAPVGEIGVSVEADRRADGVLYLDWLTWDGAPTARFVPRAGAEMWRRAWVNGADRFEIPGWDDVYVLIQNEGTGLAIQGTREWADYRVTAPVEIHMAEAAGIAARVQGMRRYYALLLGRDGRARLVRAWDGEVVLAETGFTWTPDTSYELSLLVRGPVITAAINGAVIFTVTDADRPLTGGGIALVCREGRMLSRTVTVCPA